MIDLFGPGQVDFRELYDSITAVTLTESPIAHPTTLIKQSALKTSTWKLISEQAKALCSLKQPTHLTYCLVLNYNF